MLDEDLVYETSNGKRLLTNMAQTLILCKSFVSLWLDVIEICRQSSTFASQAFIIASLKMRFHSNVHGFATV
jgi:hypothetical protein